MMNIEELKWTTDVGVMGWSLSVGSREDWEDLIL